jgi:hypothetical protein
MKEMHETQQAVINLMASLRPKDQAFKKQQLLDSLTEKQKHWQLRLSCVPKEAQNKFLLGWWLVRLVATHGCR